MANNITELVNRIIELDKEVKDVRDSAHTPIAYDSILACTFAEKTEQFGRTKCSLANNYPNCSPNSCPTYKTYIAQLMILDAVKKSE